ncbi:hypothetical protein TNCV_26251 [Trichonephila clavipes]|uniref:Uncharacterized protein n=1 Tax=Trichonephila clavipes TaxID=2585209 RepID=A0A8X6W1K6_TRICX|nr:hypothetical protein TNCV_26251 [Trichonephila clavipes]
MKYLLTGYKASLSLAIASASVRVLSNAADRDRGRPRWFSCEAFLGNHQLLIGTEKTTDQLSYQLSYS